MAEMMTMAGLSEDPSGYVQLRHGNVYVGPTRVTLPSIVFAFKRGQTPVAIQDSFPTVPLAAIYGAIAYYLDHRNEVEAYLRELDERVQRLRAEAQAADPEWYAMMRKRMAEARPRLRTDEEYEREDDAENASAGVSHEETAKL